MSEASTPVNLLENQIHLSFRRERKTEQAFKGLLVFYPYALVWTGLQLYFFCLYVWLGTAFRAVSLTS